MAQGSLVIDGAELSGIKESIPVSHVDQDLLDLVSWVLELREEAAGAEIVVVLVDLTKSVADFQVLLIVLCPVLFATCYRNTTVRALKVDVCWWGGASGLLCACSSFRIVDEASLLVITVWTPCILSHESSAFSDLWRWRLGELVEEVVWEEQRAPLSLRHRSVFEPWWGRNLYWLGPWLLTG